MIPIEEIEQVEAIFAKGQQVKAIADCRALALRFLPGHADRISKLLAAQKQTYPGDDIRFEEFVYKRENPENYDAAVALIWCARWIYGKPATRTSGKGPTMQTYVVQTREDYAQNAFIALRRLAAPVADTDPVKTKNSRPLLLGQAQDLAILTEIKNHGYDPLELPRNPPGKPGVKAVIRNALSKNPLFLGDKIFDKAWERLAKQGDIIIKS